MDISIVKQKRTFTVDKEGNRSNITIKGDITFVKKKKYEEEKGYSTGINWVGGVAFGPAVVG
jgi:hypothetical protein